MPRNSRSTAPASAPKPRGRSRAPVRRARHQHRAHRPGQNVLAVAEMERATRAQQSAGERWVCRIAAASGTVGFLWLQLIVTAGWIAFNSWPGWPHVDPFPYIFLTLVLSIEAIFLSIFILISQNEETRLTERRNALDLQINLLAEQEGTQALRMLHQIGAKLGVHFEADPEIKKLERATRPEVLADEIEAITKRKR